MNQPDYIITRSIRGRIYDTTQSELLAGPLTVPGYGYFPAEAYLFKTKEELLFAIGSQRGSSYNWLKELGKRAAFHWLLKANCVDLAHELFPDLPILLPENEVHVDLPTTLDLNHPASQTRDPARAFPVWWNHRDGGSLQGLYVAEEKWFFLAFLTGSKISTKPINSREAKHWLRGAGVPELAEHYDHPLPQAVTEGSC